MTPVNDAARQYEEDARKEIAAWENQQPNALQSAGQKVSESLSRVAGPLGALVPKRVVNAVTEAVEKALLGMGDLVGKTVNAQSINDQRAKVREESCCDLEACDRLAQKSAALHITAAGVEGAALGSGGLATLAADVPAFMALSLRSIHDIAQAYGYTVDDDRERQFVMMTLSAVSANGIAEKQKALTALHTVGKGLNQGMTWKAIDALLANALAQPVIEQLGVKNLAKKLGLNITKRKAAQIVPVVGAAVGGGVNALMLRDITSTARMVYRRRWLEDRAKPVIDVAAAD